MKPFTFLLTLIIALQCNGLSFGFGFVAHVAATKVAEKHLTPETKTEVYRLLALVKDKVDRSYVKADGTPRPFTETVRPIDTDFERAALYLDLVRNEERRTGTWHYVNVPLSAKAYDPKYDRTRTHVVSRIEDLLLKLEDSSLPDEEKAMTLLYLIHLVEDLHVPLHVCSNNDRGGNSLKIRYYYPGKPISQATNLHAVWDYLMLDIYSHEPAPCYAFIASFDTEENRKAWMSGTPVDWANESIALGKRAYINPLSGERIQEDDILEARYQREFLPEMATRCCQAGLRLAYVLNTHLEP